MKTLREILCNNGGSLGENPWIKMLVDRKHLVLVRFFPRLIEKETRRVERDRFAGLSEGPLRIPQFGGAQMFGQRHPLNMLISRIEGNPRLAAPAIVALHITENLYNIPRGITSSYSLSS